MGDIYVCNIKFSKSHILKSVLKNQINLILFYLTHSMQTINYLYTQSL